jgi:hypothetical protein
MRPILLAVALLWVAATKVSATESIIFDGGGYTVSILVGLADRPSVAMVRFNAPDAKEWITLPRELLRTEKFDMNKRILVMHFSSQNRPDLPGSFSLSVKKDSVVLSIGGKKIKGDMDWGM